MGNYRIFMGKSWGPIGNHGKIIGKSWTNTLIKMELQCGIAFHYQRVIPDIINQQGLNTNAKHMGLGLMMLLLKNSH